MDEGDIGALTRVQLRTPIHDFSLARFLFVLLTLANVSFYRALPFECNGLLHYFGIKISTVKGRARTTPACDNSQCSVGNFIVALARTFCTNRDYCQFSSIYV